MNLPILYIKQGCPWCTDAIDYFNKINFKIELVDVLKSSDKMNDLISCSGQSKTPTLHHENVIISDFDIGEFKQALIDNPSYKEKLGL